MFVYYYVNVHRPYAEVVRGLGHLIGDIESWAREAQNDGDVTAAKLKVGTTPALSKTVEVRAWPVTEGHGVATIKLTWKATGPSSFFPAMDADLVAAGLSDEITQVSLRGSYLPPLGLVGKVFDRALLHRVAELTVQQFVDRIAHAITEVNARS